MTEEDLFMMAARIVEANIRAGDSFDTINLETVVYDQVRCAYVALGRAWGEISRPETEH